MLLLWTCIDCFTFAKVYKNASELVCSEDGNERLCVIVELAACDFGGDGHLLVHTLHDTLTALQETQTIEGTFASRGAGQLA